MNLLLMAVLMIFSSTTLSQETLDYIINIKDKKNYRGEITIKTNKINDFSLLYPRVNRDGHTRDKPIYCVKNDIVTEVKIDEKINCDEVKWEIQFFPLDKAGVDVYEQKNIYSSDDNWFIFTEWNDLYRVKGDYFSRICVEEPLVKCYEIPNLDSAPLIITSGLISKNIKFNNEEMIEISTDYPNLLDKEEVNIWLPTLRKQISFLLGVFNERKKGNFHFVWLRKDKSSGSLSGASGYNIYLSNILVDENKITSKSYKHLLKVSAHELVHFLSPLNSQIWISESIAEYLSLLSLKGTEYEFDKPINRKTLDPLIRDVGLYKANKLVTIEKKYNYYPIFYTKGVDFWNELDKKLLNNDVSLIELFPYLGGNNEDGLPTIFIDKVVSIIGEVEWNNLEKKYLI